MYPELWLLYDSRGKVLCQLSLGAAGDVCRGAGQKCILTPNKSATHPTKTAQGGHQLEVAGGGRVLGRRVACTGGTVAGGTVANFTGDFGCGGSVVAFALSDICPEAPVISIESVALLHMAIGPIPNACNGNYAFHTLSVFSKKK